MRHADLGIGKWIGVEAMTKDEALDLALEALEWQQHMLITAMQYSAAKGMTFLGHPPNPNEAITAIKQARSAPVQEPVKFLANGTRFKTSEFPYGVCINGLPKELSGRWVALVAAEDDCRLQLTTPPAAQRQWVGLTDEEMDELVNRFARYELVRATENLLRSKNA
jgi:hypothetical protein